MRLDWDAAILDMDGVVTRTAGLHARAWKQMFDVFLEAYGRRTDRACGPFDPDRDYRTYVDGKARDDGVRSFLAARGIRLPEGEAGDPPARETVRGLGNRKNEVFQQLLRREGADVYEDTLEQIRAWKGQGLKVAVISSSRNCRQILGSAGVLELFDAKVDGDDLQRLGLRGKPAPDIFLRAAEELGVSPQRALVVEDALAGVQAGRAGGFGLVVGVARKGDADELRQHGADVVVHDLRELQSLGAHPGGSRGSPPLALEHLGAFEQRLTGQRLALFLDYDGTLTPIVDRPEQATLSERMRALLARLAERCTLAIISGRDRRDVEGMVRLSNLVFAGSHGFDIVGPQGLHREHEEAKQHLDGLEAAEGELRDGLRGIEGAFVERKRFAIAVHYRLAADQDVGAIEAIVEDARRGHASLRKMDGKKVFELQPDVEWDKGRAVLWLREALGVDRSDYLTIYIGDDVTDEDAFRALAEHGAGLGIIVASPVPETTRARYRLRDCGEVERFLEALESLLGATRGET
jgi:trehalose-phosphatase